jgi:hypothetical protein
MVRIGAGVRPAGGCCRSQPVCWNRCHHRRHHHHSKVDRRCVWSTVRIGAGARPAGGRCRSQPVCQNRCHRHHHHCHSKVDRRRVRSTVRIGAGARPAGGRCHSQPVRRNRCHHRHHHRHSKVDGWHVRSTVRIGAGARPASGHHCRPAWGLVLGHHSHRVTKGAGAELRARRLGTATPHGRGHVQGQLACTKATDRSGCATTLKGPPPVVLSQNGGSRRCRCVLHLYWRVVRAS